MTEDTELRKEAKVRAEMKLSFYVNVVLYIIINSFLIYIWYSTGSTSPWIIWPLIGWGIALIAHYLLAFVFTGRTFFDGMVEKEYRKLTRD
ncbi:MAG: 2TM domain-containing protein [Candidatus Thorarchaeota archaeon]